MSELAWISRNAALFGSSLPSSEKTFLQTKLNLNKIETKKYNIKLCTYVQPTLALCISFSINNVIPYTVVQSEQPKYKRFIH